MGRSPNIIPLGKFTIATAGTTVLLSANCGPLAGQVGGTMTSPNLPGLALRQIRIGADHANTGQVFLLPRGSTVSANPGNIIAVIGPGEQITIPDGVMIGNGMLPENFCFDTDTSSQVVYGCGITG